jgi:hypothetical protein
LPKWYTHIILFWVFSYFLVVKLQLISSNEIIFTPNNHHTTTTSYNKHTKIRNLRSLWTAYLTETELKSKFTSLDVDERAQCDRQFPNAEKPRPLDEVSNKYKLWSGVMSNYDLEQGKVLYGMYDGLEAIWKNQNPDDCSNATFLLAENFDQGFGAELHVQGQKLALALSLGRVLIQGNISYLLMLML